MAKTREQKKELMKRYKDALADNPNYILVNMHGVTMPQITELKMKLKETDSQFFVVKNSVFKIAARETDQPTKIQEFEDSTGVIISGPQITQPAKILKELQKEHETMDTKFGVLFGDLAEADKVQQLAEIPSREELLSKLVGSISSPVRGFMSAVTGNARGFVQVLSQIKEAKQ